MILEIQTELLVKKFYMQKFANFTKKKTRTLESNDKVVENFLDNKTYELFRILNIYLLE